MGRLSLPGSGPLFLAMVGSLILDRRSCRGRRADSRHRELRGHDDLRLPHGSDHDVPGAEPEPLRADQDLPERGAGRGPGDTSPFAPGSSAEGFVTRFKPSMVEVHEDGSVTTPSVWDLHLHHVVWLGPGVGFGTGEEKSEWKLPQGYGFKVDGDADWGLNYMIHNLTAGRRPPGPDHLADRLGARDEPGSHRHQPDQAVGLDVAGTPQIYPVFDAERGFDPTATASTPSPTTSRPTRTRPATRSARRSAARSVDRPLRRPDTGLRRRAPASRWPLHGHAGGARRARRRHDRRRRSVGGQTAVQIRRSLLRAGGRGELGRVDDGHPPRLASSP